MLVPLPLLPRRATQHVADRGARRRRRARRSPPPTTRPKRGLGARRPLARGSSASLAAAPPRLSWSRPPRWRACAGSSRGWLGAVQLVPTVVLLVTARRGGRRRAVGLGAGRGRHASGVAVALQLLDELARDPPAILAPAAAPHGRAARAAARRGPVPRAAVRARDAARGRPVRCRHAGVERTPPAGPRRRRPRGRRARLAARTARGCPPPACPPSASPRSTTAGSRRAHTSPTTPRSTTRRWTRRSTSRSGSSTRSTPTSEDRRAPQILDRLAERARAVGDEQLAARGGDRLRRRRGGRAPQRRASTANADGSSSASSGRDRRRVAVGDANTAAASRLRKPCCFGVRSRVVQPGGGLERLAARRGRRPRRRELLDATGTLSPPQRIFGRRPGAAAGRRAGSSSQRSTRRTSPPPRGRSAESRRLDELARGPAPVSGRAARRSSDHAQPRREVARQLASSDAGHDEAVEHPRVLGRPRARGRPRSPRPCGSDAGGNSAAWSIRRSQQGRRRAHAGGIGVALRRPLAALGRVAREAPDELGAQVLGLDDRVDHHLRREVQQVDALGVLVHQLARAWPRARPRPRSPAAGCRRPR